MNEDFVKKMNRSAGEQYLLQEDILNGRFGPSGNPFMTTQKLADKRAVSLVTAHNIMTGLRDAGYIELRGKKYYLCYDKLKDAATGNSKLLGLLLPKMNNEFYSTLADCITVLARENGYSVLVMAYNYIPEEERRIHGLFKKIPVDGIICCGPTFEENTDLLAECPLPHVVLGHAVNTPNCTTVQVNSFTISQKVAEHLVSSGYKRFIYFGNKHVPLENDIRYLGFRMGLNQKGFNITPADVALSLPNEDNATAMISALLEKQPMPVGAFCNNDLFASMLYNVCREKQLSIPDDVGIVGFDDLSIAKVLRPALSTVCYRMTTMADTALKQLFLQIANPDIDCDNFFIEPTLVIRGSSCPGGS